MPPETSRYKTGTYELEQAGGKKRGWIGYGPIHPPKRALRSAPFLARAIVGAFTRGVKMSKPEQTRVAKRYLFILALMTRCRAVRQSVTRL